MKYFIYTVIGIVALSIIAGFFIVGSPQEERLRRFDLARVDHLVALQLQILSYWQTKGKLPEKLENLRDDISGFVPPVDPETGDPYEYQVNGSETFTLCAVFARPSDDQLSRSVAYPQDPFLQNETWKHGEGRTCYVRTIDKEKYKLPPAAPGIPAKPLPL